MIVRKAVMFLPTPSFPFQSKFEGDANECASDRTFGFVVTHLVTHPGWFRTRQKVFTDDVFDVVVSNVVAPLLLAKIACLLER